MLWCIFVCAQSFLLSAPNDYLLVTVLRHALFWSRLFRSEFETKLWVSFDGNLKMLKSLTFSKCRILRNSETAGKIGLKKQITPEENVFLLKKENLSSAPKFLLIIVWKDSLSCRRKLNSHFTQESKKSRDRSPAKSRCKLINR